MQAPPCTSKLGPLVYLKREANQSLKGQQLVNGFTDSVHFVKNAVSYLCLNLSLVRENKNYQQKMNTIAARYSSVSIINDALSLSQKSLFKKANQPWLKNTISNRWCCSFKKSHKMRSTTKSSKILETPVEMKRHQYFSLVEMYLSRMGS